jgi:branched-chain amino acid transport system permease protein
MDREAAQLMGVNVSRIYAITFGLGGHGRPPAACSASCSRSRRRTANALLGKAFVICVLGGLGSVPA